MLTIKNCHFYFELSKIFDLKGLQDFFYNTFFQCYLTHFNLTVFYELSYKDLLNLISSSELQTDSELEVFNAIVDWISYKQSERKIYIDKLLKLVRLPLLTREIIVNVIQAHKLCSNNLNCKIIVDKALEIKRNKYQFISSILLQNRYYSRKINIKEVMFIGGKYIETAKESCQSIAVSYKINSTEMNRTKTTIKSNVEKEKCISLVIGTKIYCIGHRGVNSNISTFQVYCRRTDRWKNLAQIPDYRSSFCACSFMGRIYVFGGKCSENSLVYDPASNRWRIIANTIVPERSCSSSTVFQGQCVVVGGYHGEWNKFANYVEAYDHYLDKWSLLPNMKARRVRPGLLSRGNKLYVIAGGTLKFRGTHEVYDCLSKKFTFIAPKLEDMSDYSQKFLFTVDNSIFVFTHCLLRDSEKKYVLIPTYDIVENKWYPTVKKMSDIIDNYFYSVVNLHQFLK